ncbi:MAG: flavodoxin family protein [Oscillospiraceae bacterium]|nr:flavodoxin family protein [Oscillospiraceae bacterium]
MHCCVLFASPRGKESNTLALTQEFLAAWHAAGHTSTLHSLYDLHISPCYACRGCQQDFSAPNCVVDDDMQPIFHDILAADLVLLCSPIYNWGPTAPMKAALDRCIYALCKFYRGTGEKGPSLWEGKPIAVITSAGYRIEKATDLWTESLRRSCKHGGMRFLGLYGERHRSYTEPFMDEEKRGRTRAFAQHIMEQL